MKLIGNLFFATQLGSPLPNVHNYMCKKSYNIDISKPAVFVPQYKVPAEELLGNGPFDGEALLLPVPCLKLLRGGNGGGGVLEPAWETLAVAVQLGEKCLGSVGIFCRHCFITLDQR
uniref:Uncharacterized protein n=1 Tax=Glossina palpalis gambiensis TaxID=67801 RepID=A0A1B0C4D2_9MUSC